jgi:hypothetical protein
VDEIGDNAVSENRIESIIHLFGLVELKSKIEYRGVRNIRNQSLECFGV